ncbi:MAG: hypothetical protein KDD45_04355 [Bdellovibrionales bacterium]|nr:hypothetical protein [Bdellovibrionales bacterium]
MKKIIIFILTLSAISFARSRVGEWAAYDYTEKTAQSDLQGQLVKEVIGEQKKVINGEKVTLLNINERFVASGRQIKERSYWDVDTSFFNKFELKLFVFLCRFQSRMGKYRHITVKAGSFDTCKVKDQENWVGAVPFGTVLSIIDDGTTFRRYELINYSWKKKN